MSPGFKKWAHGLVGGFVGGMAGALDSSLALMALVPKEFNLGPQLAQTIRTAVVLGVLVGVKCACAYLKQSPIPPDVDNSPVDMNKIKSFLFLTAGLAIGVLALTPGCTTTKSVFVTDGVTNVVSTTTVDTNKLSDVREALEPAVASAIRRVLKNSPEHSDEIAGYMRSVGAVFCDMSSANEFSPAYLVDALDKIVTPDLPDNYSVDIKNSAVAIYKIAFGNRFSASLRPDEWLDQVCLLICDSVNTGLKDAGKTGITK